MITTPSMGLKRWDQPNDVFSYTELSDNWALVDGHDHTVGKGVQIPTGGLANLAVTETKLANNAVTIDKLAANSVSGSKIVSGVIDTGHIANDAIDSNKIANLAVGTAELQDGAVNASKVNATLATTLGVTSGGVTRRGMFIQSGSGSRSLSTYGALSNGPDEVPNVVVPTGGLVLFSYSANWVNTAGTAKAAIFIGANQLTLASSNNAAPVAVAATQLANANIAKSLHTYGGGLHSGAFAVATSYTGDVTTGQALGVSDAALAADAYGTAFTGGLCVIDNLAAGTYTFSVQYKSSSGTVTAQHRRLKLWVVGY